MPEHHGISDPGEEIVQKAINESIKIVPIPGACAMINALIASGLSTREFVFLGFLSANSKEKMEKLEENKYETKTLIIYEAPHKLKDTLEQINKVLGDRKIVLARELTKIYEEYIRGTSTELIETINEPKGEYVILIEGAKKTKAEIEKEELIKMDLSKHYEYYENQNMDKKEIIKQIAKDRNVPKNEIYQYFIQKNSS